MARSLEPWHGAAETCGAKTAKPSVVRAKPKPSRVAKGAPGGNPPKKRRGGRAREASGILPESCRNPAFVQKLATELPKGRFFELGELVHIVVVLLVSLSSIQLIQMPFLNVYPG